MFLVFSWGGGKWKKWEIFSFGTVSFSFLGMAYSSVRVQFEIGHDASVRNKRTPEGFTHDWQVFVRGADNTDIQCFVEKVVFHLHETFQKPKRVVKDPPYAVKECGYAGFVLPIDVYLKNKEEPKKITFQYDLQLQSSGPPISKVQREPRVFQNPSEDFRRKLIRGGGVGVDAPAEDGKKKVEDPKPVLPKKHKPDLPLSNSFADLFGPPIQRVNIEPKKAVDPPKKVEPEKKKVSKPVKDEKDYNRDREKEKLKERDKIKEKIKKPSSPVPIKVKEEPKKTEEREKKREEVVKVEKDRKEKYKEKEVEKPHKKDKKEDVVKERVSVPEKVAVLSELDDTSRDRSDKEKHKHKHKKKEKDRSREKDKHKHKEKELKERIGDKTKRKEEERVEKRVPRSLSPSPSPSPPPKHREKKRKGPLGALFNELSDSAPSEDEETSARSYEYPPADKLKHTKDEKSRKDKIPKKRTVEGDSKRIKLEKRDRSDSIEREREKEREAEAKRQREELERREREEEEERRLRREEEERRIKEKEEEERRLREKEEDERKAREREKEKAAKKERILVAASKAEAKKLKENRKRSRDKIAQEKEEELAESVVPVEGITEEYLIQLRELQRRIMALDDNTEIRKLVQLISATGQYEITKKTFDFDLCTLDPNTVRQLQDFFEDST